MCGNMCAKMYPLGVHRMPDSVWLFKFSFWERRRRIISSQGIRGSWESSGLVKHISHKRAILSCQRIVSESLVHLGQYVQIELSKGRGLMDSWKNLYWNR